MTLVRRETKKGHSYYLDGKPVKGVTTLLSGGLPKPALTYWAAKSVAEFVADNPDSLAVMRDTMGRDSLISALKSVPWDKRDEAAARGTDIHNLAERIIHGEEVDVPEHLSGYVQGYVDWLDAWGITVHATETVVGRRPRDGVPGFAGTFDADGTFGRSHLAGKRGLLDWKTSKGVYGENALQLAAYSQADFYLDDDGNEQPMPRYDFLGVVHITPTGTDLYVVEDPIASWRIFRHVAYVATQVDAIKSQISEPTPTPQGAPA